MLNFGFHYFVVVGGFLITVKLYFFRRIMKFFASRNLLPKESFFRELHYSPPSIENFKNWGKILIFA
jgi:hypothetical protein